MKPISAPGYDRFKTIVAILLVVILLLMLLRGCANTPAAPVPTETVSAPNVTSIPPTAVETETIPTENATATPTPLPVSPTLEPTETPTASSDTATPTEATTATSTPTAAATVTTPATPEQNTSCNTSAPSRLKVGQSARVLERLNMRTDASISAKIIQTNSSNTQVEIIGGPTCTPVGDRAYLWWQIRLANGTEGWSAETALNNATYFLEPIQ